MNHIYFDERAFTRIDNASLIDFFSSAGAILAKHQAISEKDVDNLRLCLGGIQLSQNKLNTPLFLQLIEQGSEFLSLLTVRYGVKGLAANLLRYSLQSQIAELRQALSKLGQVLIDKSKLKVNQQIDLMQQGRFEGVELFAGVLLGISEDISALLQALSNLKDSLGAMCVHQMESRNESDDAIDQELMANLGFSSLQIGTCTLLEDEFRKDGLSASLVLHFQLIRDRFSSFFEHLPLSARLSSDLLFEDMLMSSRSLATIDLVAQPSLTALEIKRQQMISALAKVSLAVEQIAQVLRETIGLSQSNAGQERDTRKPHQALSAARKRRLVYELCLGGEKIERADEAVEALDSYLIQQKVDLKNLIPSEYKTVHPAFEAVQVQRMTQHLGEAQASDQLLNVKKSNARRLESLSKAFLGPMSILLLCLFNGIFPGCGVKKPPLSQIETLRPNIPFRFDYAQPTTPELKQPVQGTQPGLNEILGGNPNPETDAGQDETPLEKQQEERSPQQPQEQSKKPDKIPESTKESGP